MSSCACEKTHMMMLHLCPWKFQESQSVFNLLNCFMTWVCLETRSECKPLSKAVRNRSRWASVVYWLIPLTFVIVILKYVSCRGNAQPGGMLYDVIQDVKLLNKDTGAWFDIR
ncbi:hypothetical protein Dimus_030851 [Dionaea muscipula]